MLKKLALSTLALGALTTTALADSYGRPNGCEGLPSWQALKNALQTAVADKNAGFGYNMWGTIVGKSGVVCAVAFSGSDYTSQWLASRVISAQKANTANGLSLSSSAPPPTAKLFKTGLALSTANLYSAVQPGGSLFGLQLSNPVDTKTAYFQFDGSPDDSDRFGQPNDPMVGRPIGGVNVFGGGLALYKKGAVRIGGVGVSGDTSCTDHYVAWRVRHLLNLDHLETVAGVNPDPKRPDNIIFDIPANQTAAGSPPVAGLNGVSVGGFGHPTCPNSPTSANTTELPAVQ